jgi:hypothetical protein
MPVRNRDPLAQLTTKLFTITITDAEPDPSWDDDDYYDIRPVEVTLLLGDRTVRSLVKGADWLAFAYDCEEGVK